LDMPEIGYARDWICPRLDMPEIGYARDWICPRLDMPEIGYARDWICPRLDMNDCVIEYRKAKDTVTTNQELIPVDAAHDLLKTTHWAAGLSREMLARAMVNSLCFGVLRGGDLIGFARVI